MILTRLITKKLLFLPIQEIPLIPFTRVIPAVML